LTNTNDNNIAEEILTELAGARRAMEEGNPGKARVCCRRAIGAAVRHNVPSLRGQPLNAIAAIRHLLAEENLPEPLRTALVRLSSKATHDERDRMSDTPINDAVTVLRYLGYTSHSLDEYSL